MTRATKISAFVAMGLLLAASTVTAQQAPAITSGGEIAVRTLGTEDIESSKFTEYREVPKGVSIPFVNLWSTGGKLDFNVSGQNVSQSNQRYFGWAKALGVNVKFSYNQIPHNMGNDAHLIYNQASPGVWTLADNLQQALQTAVDTRLPTSTRTYDFYNALLAPTLASTNLLDNSGLRKTGNVSLNFGDKLPFDLTLSYRNEMKEGYRGLGSVNFRERVSPSIEFLTPMDEITHDIGLRAARNFAKGNIYATFNRSLYDSQAEVVLVDFPFQAADAPYTAAAGAVPALGGLSRERFVMAPDNAATNMKAGFLLKLAKQTRINASVALGTWTQDAPFYPYTANTALPTPAGQNAASYTALQQQSYGGQVNTTMYNLAVSSRPMEGLTLRAQYRVYDLTDKSDKYVITGDVSGSNSVWTTVTATTDAPYGHATANVYDTKSARYSASASYDYKAFTLEGQVRGGKLERTSREAEQGTENAVGVTALYHFNDWLAFRGTYDVSKRTADGHTVYGFQTDEAAYTNTRTGLDIELTPRDNLEFSVAYFKREREFTDRPDRIAVSGGVPIAGAVATPNTPSGLLFANFDSYTGEVSWAPTTRLELGGYYTYEKEARTNQWATTNSATATVNPLKINNLLNYVGTDETNAYGAHVVFQVVPDKGTLTLNAMNQKVAGLLDVTALETGTFYTPGRTGLIPSGQGGAADIADWDDSEFTSLSASLGWTMTKAWGVSLGYAYEKYDFKDAFSATNKLLPSSVNIFTKPNDGAYDASIVYARLTFKF
jgi:hypothetical protein